MTKKYWGGSRNGAGRPTADGAKNLHAVLVMLNVDQIKMAKIIGEGNMSLGIRRAVEIAMLDKIPGILTARGLRDLRRKGV